MTTRIQIEQARQGREDGFTLVEALIAVLVLVVGLVSISGLFVAAQAYNFNGNQATAAGALASQQLEALKAMPFQALAAGGDLAADQAGFNRDVRVDGIGKIHVRWQVVSVPAGGYGLYHITVRAEGRNVQAQFATMRACTNTAAGCPGPVAAP